MRGGPGDRIEVTHVVLDLDLPVFLCHPRRSDSAASLLFKVRSGERLWRHQQPSRTRYRLESLEEDLDEHAVPVQDEPDLLGGLDFSLGQVPRGARDGQMMGDGCDSQMPSLRNNTWEREPQLSATRIPERYLPSRYQAAL